jgi:hypothetical protein
VCDSWESLLTEASVVHADSGQRAQMAQERAASASANTVPGYTTVGTRSILVAPVRLGPRRFCLALTRRRR